MHRDADGATLISTQEYVKEGELSVRLLLHCELYTGIDTVQVAVKGVYQVERKCCACVVDISLLKPWGYGRMIVPPDQV